MQYFARYVPAKPIMEKRTDITHDKENITFLRILTVSINYVNDFSVVLFSPISHQ